jgi:hypothetical protein
MDEIVPEPDPEFSELIKRVVTKEIPAYIEGDRVFLTNGVKIKDGGKLLHEIVADLPGRNDPCPECLKLGKQIKWKRCTTHNK